MRLSLALDRAGAAPCTDTARVRPTTRPSGNVTLTLTQAQTLTLTSPPSPSPDEPSPHPHPFTRYAKLAKANGMSLTELSLRWCRPAEAVTLPQP